QALLIDVESSKKVASGELRTCPVVAAHENGIHCYPAYAKPGKREPENYADDMECKMLVETAVWQFTDAFNGIAKAVKTKTPKGSIERLRDTVKWSAWSLLHFLSLHPFRDGNGRTARLLSNYVLSSVFPFEIPAYNLYSKTTRDDYMRALQESRRCPC